MRSNFNKKLNPWIAKKVNRNPIGNFLGFFFLEDKYEIFYLVLMELRSLIQQTG